MCKRNEPLEKKIAVKNKAPYQFGFLPNVTQQISPSKTNYCKFISNCSEVKIQCLSHLKIWGTCWEHIGSLVGPHWEHNGSFMGAHWEQYMYFKKSNLVPHSPKENTQFHWVHVASPHWLSCNMFVVTYICLS